ncbi:hypothetical protein BDZ91DRAFT_727926 [Kalaharituber pfeilii]|nr:hypothetical protein BDZ91DRAFT_727926 [Kalaharituber pfeilii]
MDNTGGTPPPAKKPRFFNDPTPRSHRAPPQQPPEPVAGVFAEPDAHGPFKNDICPLDEGPPQVAVDGFDSSLLASIIGKELSATEVKRLKQVSGDNMEKGIYLAPLSPCVSAPQYLGPSW